MTNSNDPSAFLRDLLSQWQAFSGAGQADDGSPGTAAFRQFADRAMAAVNIPGRQDLEELSMRIGRVEAALFRIEAMLVEVLATRGSPDNQSPTTA